MGEGAKKTPENTFSSIKKNGGCVKRNTWVLGMGNYWKNPGRGQGISLVEEFFSYQVGERFPNTLVRGGGTEGGGAAAQRVVEAGSYD